MDKYILKQSFPSYTYLVKTEENTLTRLYLSVS